MRIGALASQAGVTIDTVRFYERKGLLHAPPRGPSGYRDYAASAVQRVRFAKKLQLLGLSLEEIIELLNDVDRGVASCDGERVRFDAVLARVDAKLSGLRKIRSLLVAELTQCEQGHCGLLAEASAAKATS